MNASAFALASAAYFNLDADGSDTPLDLGIGVLAEIFVAKKMMGLFSLLFGVGIVVFAERAKANGRRPLLLSGWRNLLLLGIGLAHMAVWDGDILVLYAICSPFLLLARRLPPKLLITAGAAMFAAAAAWAVGAQATIDSTGDDLGKYWFETETSSPQSGTFLPGVADNVGAFFVADAFLRAMGMMHIGIGLYRLGIVQGLKDRQLYVRMARWGLGIGLPLASWRVVFDRGDAGRSTLVVFIVAVWALQYAWSGWWLARYRFGPAEWLWRCATYRKTQPLRR